MVSVFQKMSDNDIKKMINTLNCRKSFFQKGKTILSNLDNINQIAILLSGSAIITKYDYYGNRMIIEQLEKNSAFGKIFSTNSNNTTMVETVENSEILFIDYDVFIEKITKNSTYGLFLNNMLEILSSKLENSNNRIEILTNRTIREKLLNYFKVMVKDKINATFTLPFSYTNLADFLAIDRCAMMREIKYLKEERIINCNKRTITINRY